MLQLECTVSRTAAILRQAVAFPIGQIGCDIERAALKLLTKIHHQEKDAIKVLLAPLLPHLSRSLHTKPAISHHNLISPYKIPATITSLISPFFRSVGSRGQTQHIPERITFRPGRKKLTPDPGTTQHLGPVNLSHFSGGACLSTITCM